jgi:hypothetical protein
MFFFPMFWTVYIPILITVLSLAAEWLMGSFCASWMRTPPASRVPSS